MWLPVTSLQLWYMGLNKSFKYSRCEVTPMKYLCTICTSQLTCINVTCYSFASVLAPESQWKGYGLPSVMNRLVDQESTGLVGESLLGVSALSFISRFDIVHWLTGKALARKNLLLLSISIFCGRLGRSWSNSRKESWWNYQCVYVWCICQFAVSKTNYVDKLYW